jgi:ribonuclease VapC
LVVVDSSVLIAIVRGEDDPSYFQRVLASHPVALPASCMLEVAIVARQKSMQPQLSEYVVRLAPKIVPFDGRQAAIAIDADRRYGRGSGHPAQLNFGDCMSYAAAVALGAPLLFKGDDFAQTDVRRFGAAP